MNSQRQHEQQKNVKKPQDHQKIPQPLFKMTQRKKQENKLLKWSIELKHPINTLHVTPQEEIVAIGTRKVTVFDKKGRKLWNRNFAPGDKVIPSGHCFFLNFFQSSKLSNINTRGATNWERDIDGSLHPLGNGLLMAIDAASVRTVECRKGREVWMFSPDRVRSLRLLSVTHQTIALLGEIGKKRKMYILNQQGQLQNTINLPESATFAQSLSSHHVAAFTAEKLTVSDHEGNSIWSVPITNRTEVIFQDSNAILAHTTNEGIANMQSLNINGEKVSSCSIRVGEEPVSLNIVAAPNFPKMLTACTGALSSCSEGTYSTGPYNRLWVCPEKSNLPLNIIDSRLELYFDISFTQSQAVSLVASTTEGTVDVIIMDGQLNLHHIASLKGRRMLGPVRGPKNLWFVATCSEHHCGTPWMLHAFLPLNK